MTQLQNKIILLWLLLLSLASCQEGRWRLSSLSAEEEEKICYDLNLADSLMEDNPDSSMTILRCDSALMHRADKADRMMYALLKTQAEDKLYVPHQSDSIIRKVASYFSEQGNARQQVQAWYLLGRVEYDLHLKGSALSAFEASLSIEEEDSVVCIYKSRAASWIGDIYEEKNLHKLVLQMKEKANHYAKKAGSQIEQVYTLRDLGRSYNDIKQKEKAISYYQKAVNLAKRQKSPYLYNMVSEELAYLYIQEGLYREAHQALSVPVIVEGSAADIMSRNSIWAAYYAKIGAYDSAIMAYQRALDYAPADVKVKILHDMSSLLAKFGKKSEALEYALLAQTYSDSLKWMESKEYQDVVCNVEENAEIQKRNKELSHDRLMVVYLVCILGIVTIVISYRFKKRKTMLSNENKRIAKYYKKIHDMDSNKILELKKQYKEQQHELDSLSNQIQPDIVPVSQKTAGEKKLLEKELVNSTIYSLFHNPTFYPKEEDYLQLEEALDKTYDNFTVRLKQLNPKLSKADVRICCLLKIELPLKIIAIMLAYSPSNLSTKRARLYKKLFKENGSAEQLDIFIKSF